MALSFKHGFWANALEIRAEIWYGPRASLCPQHYQAFFHLDLRWPGYLVANLSIQYETQAKMRCFNGRRREVLMSRMRRWSKQTWWWLPVAFIKKTFKNSENGHQLKKCLVKMSSTSLILCIFFSSQYTQGCMRYSSLKLSAISCAGSGTFLDKKDNKRITADSW